MGRDSGKQKKENMKALSPEQEAGLKQKAEEISKGLQSYTWRDLETGGKFTHNDKLTFIRDDMLIVGCDIGSERHYARAIDAKGRELSKGAANAPQEEIYITAKEAAKMLGVTLSTLWRWDNDKYLEKIKIGNKVRYRLSDVDRMIKGAI